MAELELIGLHEDGEHLVLGATDGQRYLLPIDEALRAAVRRDRPQLEQIRAERSGAPSPREIQSRVRAGQSAEQIAEESGLSVEHVRRFEGPVVAEREYVAEQARGTRVGRDVGAPVLGDLVVDRLAARGVDPDTVQWDAFREPGEGWAVVARYRVDGKDREARWGFDPSARSVHADEDEARWLSETEITDGPLPRRHLSAVRDLPYDVDAGASVRPVLAAVDGPAPAAPEEPEDEVVTATHDLLDDLRARRGVRQSLDMEDDEDDEEFGGFGPAHAFDFGLTDPPSAHDLPEVPGAHPADADPGAETRVFPAPVRQHPTASRKDKKDEKDPAEPKSPVAAVPDGDDAPSDGATGTTDRSAGPKPADAPAPRSRKSRGRAKVPSWDEIVFGAKPE